MKRKSLLLIAFTLVFTTVLNLFAGVIVFAEDTASTDTVTEITDAEGLRAIADNLSGNYKLMNNIDLSVDGEKTAWTPLGDNTTPFTGTLDGNGKTISGFTCTSSSTQYIGLFGKVYGGEIRNLTIADADFATSDTSYEIGAVCGRLEGTSATDKGIIFGCTTKSSVTISTHSESQGGNVAMGGIVGYVSGDGAFMEISYCVNNAKLSAVVPNTGKLEWVGGIAGCIYRGTVTYCVNNGDVSVTGEITWGPYKFVCGGIVGRSHDQSNGWNHRAVTYCVNFGDVTHTTKTAGGILGATTSESDPKSTILHNNFNFGYVNGATHTGLITGCHSTKTNAADVKTNYSVKIGDVKVCNFSHDATVVATASELKENETYKSIIEAVKTNNPTFETITTDYYGYQTNNPTAEGKFDLRLIATFRGCFNDDLAKVSNVGFKVSAAYVDQNNATQTKNPDSNFEIYTLYMSITSVENGVENEETTVSAAELGGDYIYVLACKGLPADAKSMTFTVTTFYTDLDHSVEVIGETVTVTVDMDQVNVA